MSDKLSLPSSSYDELAKILKGYSNVKRSASLDEIAKLIGIHRTLVSANNKFLVESGLITGGNKKAATDLGAKLGRALDHNQAVDIKAGWKEMISNNEGIAGLVTTVRIKGGMSSEELASHILYVSGQKNTKSNRTGANALVEILTASGLLEESDGKLLVAQPSDESIYQPNDSDSSIQQDIPPIELQQQNNQAKNQGQPVYQVSTQAAPQIAINIQLHLPETDNPEVYKNLFKALKENLLSHGE